MARTLESFGLKEHETGGQKSSGPVEASSVRKHGDVAMSDILAEALAASESVDRGTHAFHTYPARMHPDSARLIIPHTTGAVHDHLWWWDCTIEAKLAGRKSSGQIFTTAHLVVGARLSSPLLASSPFCFKKDC